ncbi:hypothetical protein PFISCL1PPCAC_26532, partial [Pristionchus fissidentatus]
SLRRSTLHCGSVVALDARESMMPDNPGQRGISGRRTLRFLQWNPLVLDSVPHVDCSIGTLSPRTRMLAVGIGHRRGIDVVGRFVRFVTDEGAGVVAG